MAKISSSILLVLAGLVAYLALKPGSSNNDAIPAPTLQSQDTVTLAKISDARSQNQAIESRISDINSELSIFKDKSIPCTSRACRFQTFAKGTRFTINPFTNTRVLIGFSDRASQKTRNFFAGSVADINKIIVAREFQSNLLTERSAIQATSRQNTLFLSGVGL